jgi:hypothetical protein
MCIPPPPQPERLVMRKDEAVGNKEKMQVCLPKHNNKLDNNLLTVEPRAVDPHCFDADPEPDPDPVQNPPWQNPRYAPDCPEQKKRCKNQTNCEKRWVSIFSTVTFSPSSVQCGAR